MSMYYNDPVRGRSGREARKDHPELRKGTGEIFMFNIDVPLEESRLSVFKTARLGDKAYDICGNVVKSCKPVFVLKSELDALRKSGEW